MSFRSDVTISQPKNQGSYITRKDLGGFGWHPDRGLFIPVIAQDNITEPYASGMNPKTIVDPITQPSKKGSQSSSTSLAQQISNNSQRIPHE